MARTLFLILLLAGLLVGGALNGGFAEEGGPIIEELKLFSKALGVIHEAYVNDVDLRVLLYKAVEGMLASLDKYCEFFGPEKYELIKIHMKGEYAGIGAVLQELDGIPAIRGLQPGSAAESAGLKVRDKILKIDGVSMKGKPIPEIAQLLRGEAEAPVKLEIWRDAENRGFEIVIQRKKIVIESVLDSRMAGRAVGYVRLVNFQDNTAAQMDEQLARLDPAGMKALILDLRNNEGGLLPQAVALAERFLPAGSKIVTVSSKIEEQRKEYAVTGPPPRPDLRLVILLNHKSASASEILTAALQDHKRATVIGTRSYGKASVQSVVPLDDRSAMKITTARYLRPSGEVIDSVGVRPDIELEGDSADGSPVDEQLLKAIEVLKEYM
ncbi:MAG: S41 family peptidase [Candidatus Omnitrophica bacterium]|nr:S41 family peptidase [Candidatus Omnitrophota bacterium]